MEYDLVFEGGGAKGSVFVGAVQEFEAREHTARRFVGTSAGAITATLMAAGYTSQELLVAANEKLPDGKPRFSSFMDIPDKFKKRDIHKSLTYAIFDKVDIPLLEAYREIFSFV